MNAIICLALIILSGLAICYLVYEMRNAPYPTAEEQEIENGRWK